MSKTVSVQVAYATLESQVLKNIMVPEQTTIEMAITLSGLLDEFLWGQ